MTTAATTTSRRQDARLFSSRARARPLFERWDGGLVVASQARWHSQTEEYAADKAASTCDHACCRHNRPCPEQLGTRPVLIRLCQAPALYYDRSLEALRASSPGLTPQGPGVV